MLCNPNINKLWKFTTYYVTCFVILNSITAHNFDKKDVLEEIFGSGQSSNDNLVRIFHHHYNQVK